MKPIKRETMSDELIYAVTHLASLLNEAESRVMKFLLGFLANENIRQACFYMMDIQYGVEYFDVDGKRLMIAKGLQLDDATIEATLLSLKDKKYFKVEIIASGVYYITYTMNPNEGSW
jgi:hypothetical protein